jgi:tRNA threonylcarbamoyladenosine biosynthesis protein TsaB
MDDFGTRSPVADAGPDNPESLQWPLPAPSSLDPARGRRATGAAAAIVLAIDTCGPTGSVALGRIQSGTAADIALLAAVALAPKTYSAQLLPAIEEVLVAARMRIRDVDALVVVNGPGSFTGVRVGVSAAKGLAEGADIPILAISRLELLARQAKGDVCAALDAGRGEFYFGLFRGGFLETEALYTLAELIEAVHATSLGVVACEEKVTLLLHGQMPQVLQVTAPSAADAIFACAKRLVAGGFGDVSTLDGNYLRRPDAENAANSAAAPADL